MSTSLRFVRMRRFEKLALALIVACSVVAACGTGDDDATNSTVLPESTETSVAVATALSGPPRIGSAVWTSAVEPGTNQPLALVPGVDDARIYAVFPIESLPAGSQLLAQWFFNDTSLDALNSSMRIDQDRVSGWLEFHIERTGNSPWPDGEYEIVVSDGTNEVQRAVITIS